MDKQEDKDILDASLLKVPFESLKRAAKDRKAFVDEASETLGTLNATSTSSQVQQLEQLDQLVSHLQGLKRKLNDVGKQESDDAMRCKARLEHLQLAGKPAKGHVIAWSKQRFDRLLVDYMLRTGNHNAAARLAEETDSKQLSDMHIFADVRQVIQSLQQHSCVPALAWCVENRSRLRKIKSSLEFKLHLQEFIERVRQDQRLSAVTYARQHLAPWAPQHMAELQRALATLALTASTKVAPYKALFSEQQWTALLDLFYKELYRLHNLLPESQLEIHLQAGLLALKNPPFNSSSSREDPLHHPDFQALAANLPYAKHVHSKLVCAVTREIMTDANPPMVLPNGYVYSQRAVEELVAKHKGKIVCPRTGSVYTADEARRAYIV